MAKFNIEVELDWMDEEAYSIDDELRERIVEGVENALLEKATNEAVKAVDNKIAEKILEAEETIQATVDQLPVHCECVRGEDWKDCYPGKEKHLER